MKTKMKILTVYIIILITLLVTLSSFTAFAAMDGMAPVDAQALYASVKSDFQAVTYEDFYSHLNPYVSSVDKLNARTELTKELGRVPTDEEVTARLALIYIDRLGMCGAFDRVRADLDTIIPKLLEHSVSTDANTLRANKVQILLGLTYLECHYSFEVGGVSAKEVLLYAPEAVGNSSGRNALAMLTTLGENLFYDEAKESVAATLYANILSAFTGLEKITDFVEAFVIAFGDGMSASEYLNQTCKGVIKEQGEIALFEKMKSNEWLEKYLLPLLNRSFEGRHIINTDDAMVLYESTTYTYDGTEIALVTEGIASGGTMQYYIGETPPAADSSDWTNVLPVAKLADNYKIWWRVNSNEVQGNATAESIEVTIRKKPVTATITAQDKTYDGSAEAPVIAIVTEDQLISGDSITITGLKGTFSDANAGEGKTVTVDSANVSITGVNADCYEIIYPTATTATINKAATPEIVWPTAGGITYGQKLSESILTSADEHGRFAWQNSDTVPSVANGGFVVVYIPNDTHNFDYANVELTKTIPVTVSPKEITVTADNITICVNGTYTLTYTVSGLIGSDTLNTIPTLNTDATVNTAGEYTIAVGGATVGDNYTIAYENGVLTVHNHAYNGVMTSKPTCTEKGVKTFTCSHDSTHTYTEEVAIDETAHAWNEGVITKQPICTEKGVKTYTCTHNGAHTKTEDVDTLGHKYDNDCDSDCSTCGEARTPTEHYSENADGKCDECGESFELSGGAIAGIAVGSAAAVGLGGFSLFWFVIKKKKWSDLVGIFKK